MTDHADSTGIPLPPDPSLGEASEAPVDPLHADATADTGRLDEGGRGSHVMGWVITVAVAIVLTVVVKAFILQAYSIPSPSMVPTLEVGDRVVVFRLNTDPARGDIVVFDRPPNDPKTSPDDPDVLIKRVIGLGGDTVEARDGDVFVNGKRLVEDYLPEGTETTISAPIEVPRGQLLVLGDNRGESFDSRYFGTIDQDLVVGRAVARIWPLSRLGGL